MCYLGHTPLLKSPDYNGDNYHKKKGRTLVNLTFAIHSSNVSVIKYD
ncbi:Uncharacterized protein APZ42_006771 [Daphnia magna]|uniref:Uncharacterized protein n=1 Tax=Daphnia magna TaxID=35525 RepID=A0A164FPX2_9CRUS|nr:Uncharacterized protein APZ42_006771 [Daphnia magna]